MRAPQRRRGRRAGRRRPVLRLYLQALPGWPVRAQTARPACVTEDDVLGGDLGRQAWELERAR